MKYPMEDAKILIIGAGGLGCEILKSLVYSGFKTIDIIDMDTIDLSNLNRQFLFRQDDVGKQKSVVAAEFFQKKKKKDVKITPHTCRIQDKPSDFYSKFTMIIAGLDNIEARRWINALVHGLVQFSEEGDIVPSTVIPLIDGGTEGLKGQSRVIIPYISACFECSLDLFRKNEKTNAFPLCTIADKPRKPEHCIMFAYLSIKSSLDRGKFIKREFEEKFGDVKIDTDDFDHVNFIFDKAKIRANSYGIEGVSYNLTLGVVKNIIPAIASTNCYVASVCVTEALKLVTFCAPTLDNYSLINGTRGTYCYSFRLEKRECCPVCDDDEIVITVSSTLTLKALIEEYLINGKECGLSLKSPSLTMPGKLLFMQNPESLKRATEINLGKKLSEIIASGDLITVTDPTYPSSKSISLIINFEYKS